MKKIFVFLYCFFITFGLQAEQIPHLILHFDVNKTLIATDKTENKSIDNVVNELLSKKYSACWDETLKEPITFEAYVKTIILPGDEHDIKLKEERLLYLVHFIDYLRFSSHPLYDTVLEEFNLVLAKLKQSEHSVFSSFYHLLNELNHHNISYTIFLRSFGYEVFEVKNEINSIFKNLFKIEGIFQKGVLHLDNKQILSDSQALYDFFRSQNGAIRDDWRYWVDGEMAAKFGKPLYVTDDKTVLTLIFDDNIKKNSNDKNIIAPINFKTGEPVPVETLIQSKQAIPVNTLEAILDDRYYINLVQEAIKMHIHQTVTFSSI